MQAYNQRIYFTNLSNTASEFVDMKASIHDGAINTKVNVLQLVMDPLFVFFNVSKINAHNQLVPMFQIQVDFCSYLGKRYYNFLVKTAMDQFFEKFVPNFTSCPIKTVCVQRCHHHTFFVN